MLTKKITSTLVAALAVTTSLFGESATIRGDGTMVIDGKGFFPVAYRAEKLEGVKEGISCGFNMVMASGEWNEKIFKVANQAGLKILAGDCYIHFLGVQEGINLKARETSVIWNFIKHTKDQSKRSVLKQLTLFGKHPGVVGWVTNDEPEAKTTEVCEAAYDVVKSYIPEKLVFTISCDVRWASALINTADVLIYDRYLLRGTQPKERAYQNAHNSLSDNLAHCAKVWKSKSLWYMPQLYPPSYFSLKKDELLTSNDVRQQCYTALIEGAKGLVFYDWGELNYTHFRDEKGEKKSVKLTPQQKSQQLAMLRQIVKELKSLGPVICDGRPSREAFVMFTAPGKRGPGSIKHRVLDFYGKQYIFLTNPLDKAIEGVCLGANLGHNNYQKTYKGKVFAGKGDLTIGKHKQGMVTFKLAPNGSGVIELTRTSIFDRMPEELR
jgi:hypothetical protein